MLINKNKTYTSNTNFDIDRQLNEIDLNKPFTIVSGNVGSGKSTYIKAMKKFNPEMQYIEVQDIECIDMNVKTEADFIIDIRKYSYDKRS